MTSTTVVNAPLVILVVKENLSVLWLYREDIKTDLFLTSKLRVVSVAVSCVISHMFYPVVVVLVLVEVDVLVLVVVLVVDVLVEVLVVVEVEVDVDEKINPNQLLPL